jgi:xylulose-5-phosphate/fructose-6-phosphate phosphoketolase
MPDFREYVVGVYQSGAVAAEATRLLGQFPRDVIKLNLDTRHFRAMRSDETSSHRLSNLSEITNRTEIEDP